MNRDACKVMVVVALSFAGCGPLFVDPIARGRGGAAGGHGGSGSSGGRGGEPSGNAGRAGVSLGQGGAAGSGALPGGAGADPCDQVCPAGLTCTPSLFIAAEHVDRPSGIAGDFNRDGWLDLLSIDPFGSSLSVRLGIGGGAFTDPWTAPLQSGTQRLTTGDFDNDGKVDVVTLTLAGTVPFIRGQRDGTFVQAGLATAIGAGAVDFAAGDMNADGLLDLVVVYRQTQAFLGLYLGKGDGTFELAAPATMLDFDDAPSAPVLADLDGDGRLDVVIRHPSGVSVVHNALRDQPLDVFTLLPGIPTAEQPVAMALADLDEDGRVDLLMAPERGRRLDVLRGQGDGTFTARPSVVVDAWDLFEDLIAVADFNRDGHLDVLAAGDNGISALLFGKGDGSFLPQIDYATGGNAGIVGDLDHDGHLDFLTESALAFGDAQGTFQTARLVFPDDALPTPDFLLLADATRDGQLDVVEVLNADNDQTSSIFVLPGDGHGSFKTVSSWGTIGLLATAVAVGDLDGDGGPDLVAVSSTMAEVSISRSQSDGTWATGANLALPYPASHVVLADFDGDGRTDVLVSSVFQGQLAVLLNLGGGKLGAPLPLTVGPSSEVAVAGDLDHDGRVDLVVANHFFNDVSVFRGRGDGTFVHAGDFGAVPGPKDLSLADFNRDGHLDLLVSSDLRAGKVGVLLGDGTGAFGESVVLPFGLPNDDGDVAKVVVADFDGDGVPDIAARRFGGALYVLLDDGNAAFYEGRPLAFNIDATADLDHDGRLDVVTGLGGSLSVIFSTSASRCR